MPPRTGYALTEAGQALAPVLDAIATWAERYLTEPAAACEGEQRVGDPERFKRLNHRPSRSPV